MDYETSKREQRERDDIERKRLLAMTEADAMAEGPAVWYARMRHLREIEAAEWLNKVQSEVSVSSAPTDNSKRHYRSTKTKTEYRSD